MKRKAERWGAAFASGKGVVGSLVCAGWCRTAIALGRFTASISRKARSTSGQGTTEYAILVGILVVIAIIAIVAFRGKIEELWTSIATNISSL